MSTNPSIFRIRRTATLLATLGCATGLVACEPGAPGQGASGPDGVAVSVTPDAAPTDRADEPETQRSPGADVGADLVVESCDEEHPERSVGLRLCRPGAFEGYTLFAPLESTTTWLIDLHGRVVHSWDGQYTPGNAVYLLGDGHLLRSGELKPPGKPVFNAGGKGGVVRELDWDGEEQWRFEYSTPDVRLHHDVERLPNGNVLMIAWEKRTAEEAIAAGRDPSRIKDGVLWPDHIIEVAPTGPQAATIVWEWHAWDHLVQDLDPSKENYGDVGASPGRVDLNFGTGGGPDIHHINGIAYHPERDEIVLSVHELSELWIIDHSTTTEEAAGSTGGQHGRGGDLLYRWGNPRAYRAGGAADQVFYGQHDTQWIADTHPGAGNLLVFNNGFHRPGPVWSSVDELTPAVGADGRYALAPSAAYEPAELTWTYAAEPASDLYSSHISGAVRLANGNTLICSGADGKLLEVTDAGERVWEYINPVGKGGILPDDQPVPTQNGNATNSVFKVRRYAPDYPGLAGRDLSPGEPL